MMRLANNGIQVHIINKSNLCLLSKSVLTEIPHTGDLLRFGDEGNVKYYRVCELCWIFDEPECEYQRVNITVVDITKMDNKGR